MPIVFALSPLGLFHPSYSQNIHFMKNQFRFTQKFVGLAFGILKTKSKKQIT